MTMEDRLAEALRWIKNDIAYRPPEQIADFVAEHIRDRIDAALAELLEARSDESRVPDQADSLEQVVAELRAIPNEFDAQKEWENKLADRIERLDAEMRRENDKLRNRMAAAVSLIPGHVLIGDLQDAAKEIAELRARLAECEGRDAK